MAELPCTLLAQILLLAQATVDPFLSDFVTMPSNGQTCRGVLHTGQDCTRGKNGAIMLNSACSKCHEWRCKKHCRCGRRGTALGRHAARDPRPTPEAKAKAQPKAQAKAQPKAKAEAMPRAVSQPVPVPRAVASPSPAPASPRALAALRPSGFQTYTQSTWLQQCLADLEKASTVQIASMVMDEPTLCKALVGFLRGPGTFSCRVVVDKSCFTQRNCRGQRPRLLELQQAGAQVRLATGHSGHDVYGPHAMGGVMHVKAVVIDADVAYTGSANLTKASLTNRELVLRLQGAGVAAILDVVTEAFKSGQMLTEAD